jgi:signal transduction histidine kinase
VIELGMEAMQERDPARLVKLFFGAACEMMNAEYAALGILGDDGHTLGHLLTKKLDPALYSAENGVGAGLLDPLLSRRGALRVRGADVKLGGKGFPDGHPAVPKRACGHDQQPRHRVRLALLRRAARRGRIQRGRRAASPSSWRGSSRCSTKARCTTTSSSATRATPDRSPRAQAGRAENPGLRAQLQGLSRRLVEVEESERRNLNRELHDRVGQNLAALNINLNIVRSRIPQRSLRAVSDRLDDTQRLLEETAGHIRNVMADLHPPALDEYGLRAALVTYCESLSCAIRHADRRRRR